jgi:hypothetical protein
MKVVLTIIMLLLSIVAGAEYEGGFLLFGTRDGTVQMMFGNVNYTATYRPYLEVYTQ